MDPLLPALKLLLLAVMVLLFGPRPLHLIVFDFVMLGSLFSTLIRLGDDAAWDTLFNF